MSGIVHCPRCGHHINIPSDGTAGYCPICDKEVPDMGEKNNLGKVILLCSGV